MVWPPWFLYPYHNTSVFNTFTETLGIRCHHVDVIVIVGTCVTVPGTGVDLCVANCMLIPVLSLLRANVEYLHLIRASLMSSSSLT